MGALAMQIKPKSSPALEAFMAAYRAETTSHPLAGFLRIWSNRVYFEVRPFDGAIRLALIQTIFPEDRQRGYGHAALSWFCALADRYGVEIRGHIDAQGEEPRLTAAQLRSWYKRHGFKIERTSMRRLPKCQ